MQIMVEGKVVASLDRNKKAKVSLPVLDTLSSDQDLVTLDILVEGIGRDNSGSKFDLKGLMSQEVYLNGRHPNPSFVGKLPSFSCICMHKLCCFCVQNCELAICKSCSVLCMLIISAVVRTHCLAVSSDTNTWVLDPWSSTGSAEDAQTDRQADYHPVLCR